MPVDRFDVPALELGARFVVEAFDAVVEAFGVRDVDRGFAVDRAFVDVDVVVFGAADRVDRRRFGLSSPNGRTLPTALIAPPATSPTVSAILPAVLPTA